MENKKQINENELDVLLRDLYLEDNGNSVNENEANFVLSQEYPIAIDQLKEQELLDKLQKGKGGFGNFKLYLFIFCSIVLITLIIIYILNGQRNNTVKNEKQAQHETPGINQKPKEAVADESNSPSKNTITPIKVADTFGRPRIIVSIITKDSAASNNKVTEEIAEQKNERTVPYLTEKDKLRYTKVKEQMLSKLVRYDKGLYTHIDAGKLSYMDKPVLIDAFTIRNVGISNLEYKTFLADLLLQKRNEEYLLANVVNEEWQKYNYMILAADYFQKDKYNDFPVVNISYAAAKLFCKWLEDETALYIQKNKLKVKQLKIRLPYDEEWIYAAREGYAKIAFEKGYNTIYDLNEGLVDRSFVGRAELIKKRVKRIDTLYTQFVTNKYAWPEKEILDFFNRGFAYYSTIKADTIYTDRMKVFGKLGRVSEMVEQKNSKKVWLCGLSWKNKEEYLKLEKEFKANRVSPFVGFRPVIIDPNDPDYKNPFW